MKHIIYLFSGLLFVLSCKAPQNKQTITYEMKNATATVFTTADSSTLRLTKTDNLNFSDAVQPLETEVAVFVYPESQFQTFVGIGAAVTDASAEVFAKLSPDKQQEFLTAHYDAEKGNGYSIMRTNINSCDFSSGSYTYVNDGDKTLESFTINHDKQFKIPLIKKAFETAKNQIVLFASPWSPPAYMKDNNHMLQGGKLLPEFYESWALYFTKFIKAYEAEGIPVWGISIQNEPMAKQTWESCIYTAEEERDFLKNHLGPTMQKEGFSDKKIIVWDHNRDLLVQRAHTILSDPEASKYVWGIGFHWYEPWAGGEMMFQNVDLVNDAFPDKNLIFTEGCADSFDSTRYQAWENGELYGQSIINDLNSGTVAWTDWNVLLDEKGGPNHVGNFCFAPVHADTRTNSLIYTPSYYYIGHFSKFIRPGAVRIATSCSRSQLLGTSFLNPDGTVATIVMNTSDLKINYKLMVNNKQTTITILPHAIQTIIY